MNNNLFNNKYQPIVFADFEVIEDVISNVKTLMNLDKIIILLYGPRSSGKTSLLNAIVREYYGQDISVYKNNVLYINNLKDQGINYYRNDVRTFCQTASSIKRKKKFVMIDDLDNINEQSQHVFCNCIDKYSKNVNFIASTTSLQKVIENLQSRFTITRLYSPRRENIRNVMNKIVEAERIEIDDDAKEFLLMIADFNKNIKMIINYMEKCNLLKSRITYEIADRLCTNISYIDLKEYVERIREKKLEESIGILYKIYDKGYSVIDILDTFLSFIKTSDSFSEDEKYKMVRIIFEYINIFHNNNENEIELALFTRKISEEIS